MWRQTIKNQKLLKQMNAVKVMIRSGLVVLVRGGSLWRCHFGQAFGMEKEPVMPWADRMSRQKEPLCEDLNARRNFRKLENFKEPNMATIQEKGV
jgi:hypothetical protein